MEEYMCEVGWWVFERELSFREQSGDRGGDCWDRFLVGVEKKEIMFLVLIIVFNFFSIIFNGFRLVLFRVFVFRRFFFLFCLFE